MHFAQPESNPTSLYPSVRSELPVGMPTIGRDLSTRPSIIDSMMLELIACANWFQLRQVIGGRNAIPLLPADAAASSVARTTAIRMPEVGIRP